MYAVFDDLIAEHGFNDEPWCRFLDEFEAPIESAVWQVAGQTEDYEDAVSEVYLAILENDCAALKSYAGKGTPLAFVRQLARKTAKNFLRQRGSRWTTRIRFVDPTGDDADLSPEMAAVYCGVWTDVQHDEGCAGWTIQ